MAEQSLAEKIRPLIDSEYWDGGEDTVNGMVRALRAVLDKCEAMRREAAVGRFIADEFERVVAKALGVSVDEG